MTAVSHAQNLLQIAQACAELLQLTSPSVVVASTDNNIVLLRRMILQTTQELRDEYDWPELQREYTFTLATDTDAYAFPNDIDRLLFETMWNRTQRYPLIGPLDAVEWQQYKSGLVAAAPRQRFRIKGFALNQFYIDSTPTSTENGQTCVLEYVTRSVYHPKTWAASTLWTGIQFCFYNGNFYDRGSTGAATTGTTPPTHTTGSASDGSITWTYLDTQGGTVGPFSVSFGNDTDVIILDPEIVIDGACWRFQESRGFDYEAVKARADARLDAAKVKNEAARVLKINQAQIDTPMIGPWSYPISNYPIY